jgi:hypothetical protein
MVRKDLEIQLIVFQVAAITSEGAGQHAQAKTEYRKFLLGL